MSEQIAEVHSIEAADAITTELVACTLGQRHRLELRTDVSGRLTYALRKMGESMARFKEAWERPPTIRDVPCLPCQRGYGGLHECDSPRYCPCDRARAHVASSQETSDG